MRYLFRILIAINLFGIFTFYVFAQYPSEDALKEKKREAKEKGAWLITTTSPDFEEISNTLNFILANNISPLALDRNIAGELLIISQLSPPAPAVSQWELGVYQSEKEMMQAMEETSIRGFVPTAFDTQQDAAFVLYVKTNDLLTGARLIKVNTIEELSKSVQVYYDLGFLPTAISTFKNTLWTLFIKSHKYKNLDTIDVLIKYVHKDKTGEILTQELSNENVTLIDVAYTIDDNVLLLFLSHMP